MAARTTCHRREIRRRARRARTTGTRERARANISPPCRVCPALRATASLALRTRDRDPRVPIRHGFLVWCSSLVQQRFSAQRGVWARAIMTWSGVLTTMRGSALVFPPQEFSVAPPSRGRARCGQDLLIRQPVIMTIAEKNIGTIRRVYDAFKNRDGAALAEVLADEVEISLSPELSWGDEYREREEAFTFLLKLVEHIESHVTTESLFAAGDHAVQTGRTRRKVLANGAAFDVPDATSVELRNSMRYTTVSSSTRPACAARRRSDSRSRSPDPRTSARVTLENGTSSIESASMRTGRRRSGLRPWPSVDSRAGSR